MNRKHLTAAAIVGSVLAMDIATKQWALDRLANTHTVHFADLVPMRLTYNRGVAFGLNVGDSRWVIIAATAVVLGALLVLFRQAQPSDKLRVWSLAAVIAGATGNLVDRVRWDRGVVDFIGPFNLGLFDFPIFNVADMAITIGAGALAISLWLEEHQTGGEAAQHDANATEVA